MRFAQEVDTVNGRVIVAVALATVVITAIGVLVAWLLAGPPGRSAAPFEAGRRWSRSPDEMNALEMAPFPRHMPEAPAPAAARLSHYGWSDRAQGVVHIPLERAKALYLQRRSVTASNGKPRSERGEP